MAELDAEGQAAEKRGAEGRGVEERERLRAAGALIGVPIAVSEGDAWELDESGLRVGLGWYARRGHGHEEAVALALLQLWEGVRGERATPARSRRARSIVAARPELEPLIAAVVRLQAEAELLTALPGLRKPLAAAVCRSLRGLQEQNPGDPEDREQQPRHLQWLALLLAAGVGSAAGFSPRLDVAESGEGGSEPGAGGAEPGADGIVAPGGDGAEAAAEDTGSGLLGTVGAAGTAETARLPGNLDPAVVAEWRALGGRAGRADREPAPDPVALLRRVLAPDPRHSPLARFERALALLLPPYERLLARDARDRGLGDPARGAAEPHEGGADAEDLGASGAGGEAPAQAPESGPQGGEAAAGEDERARAGEGRRAAEGADLFAAEQAGFVSAVLATPLPAQGALFAPLDLPMPPDAEAGAPRADRSREAGGGVTAGADGTVASDYRSRVAELGEAIERMRRVWERVIAERVAQLRGPGRRPIPEGETLSPEALARAVAEARAGVARPAAFLHREARPRRRRRTGSTDYVLLVDRSASMQGRIAEAAADAALIMLEALAGAERDIAHAEQRVGIELDLDIRTALVIFDAEALVVKPLSRGLDDEVRRRMHAAIRSPRGSTNDGAALRAAAEQLGIAPAAGGGRSRGAQRDGIERRRIVLLLSDGGSNDPAAAGRELHRLRAAGVAVHGIGIGSDEVVRRYAPSSRRIDEPGGIAEAIHELVEAELP